jgi:hypothetical protein
MGKGKGKGFSLLDFEYFAFKFAEAYNPVKDPNPLLGGKYDT